MINLYVYPHLISGILIFFLGFFVYFKNKKAMINKVFGLMCLSIFIWLGSYGAVFSSPDEQSAISWIRVVYLGVIFIPVTVHHLSLAFIGKLDSKNLILIRSSYIGGLILLALAQTDYFFGGVYKYFWGYYPKAGYLYNVFMIFFIYFYGRGLVQLFIAKKSIKLMGSHHETQLKYLRAALTIALVASVDYLAKYGLEIYPFGYLFMLCFVSIIAYAIVAHQLLDIEVVIRRTAVFAGLFTFVYGVFTTVTVVGQEFFKNTLNWNQWIAMIPTVLIITFSLRPLEIFLTNVTEKFLFQKKYDYRELLRTFTNEILTVLDLQKLMDQTIAGLIRIMKLEAACVLLLDKENKVFKTVAGVGMREKDIRFTPDHMLISYLRDSAHILKDKSVDNIEGDGVLKETFKKLNAQLCLPISLHDELIGVLCLGMKKSGEEYAEEDIDILTTLARTEAIAIANAQLFDELSKTQAEAAQREKMAVIGTLAAGINHEICNPLGIVRGQCEMFLLNLRDGFYSAKSQDEMMKIASDVMNKVIKETDRATAITKKLSGFAKPSKRSDLEEVLIEKEVEEVLGLIGHDLKLNNIDVQQDFPSGFPVILADKKQIQEVFFNIIRNAAQAIDQKQGKIVISGFSENGSAIVRIADNGGGIPQDKIDQIFNPFYTTKAPGKGTGLGLFIVKQVIERNKGTIAVESEVGVGTTFTLRFPTAAKLVSMQS